ncbi:MAG: hypothetical protein ACRDEA_17805, partial [Microcystaceae cyanobacterium]
ARCGLTSPISDLDRIRLMITRLHTFLERLEARQINKRRSTTDSRRRVYAVPKCTTNNNCTTKVNCSTSLGLSPP